jgi:hypothetical protein
LYFNPLVKRYAPLFIFVLACLSLPLMSKLRDKIKGPTHAKDETFAVATPVTPYSAPSIPTQSIYSSTPSQKFEFKIARNQVRRKPLYARTNVAKPAFAAKVSTEDPVAKKTVKAKSVAKVKIQPKRRIAGDRSPASVTTESRKIVRR